MLELDFINTLALGGLVLFAGHHVRRGWPLLARYNIPAPVVGGLLVAVAALAARRAGFDLVRFDTRLQAPLQIAFFTTIGYGASLSMLRAGGPQVIVLLAAATVLAALQNVIGIGIAVPLGLHPLFGVINGSVTLAGGPATALAFAPAFEAAGVAGAGTVGVAAAIVGIVSAGLVGGPVSTWLIARHRLHGPGAVPERPPAPLGGAANDAARRLDSTAGSAGGARRSAVLLKAVVAILAAMWIGSWVSGRVAALGVTLPAYIGAMLTAAVLRNLDDASGWIGLSQEALDEIGVVALSLFLVMAMMTLRLWELSGLALPMLLILAVQIVFIVLVAVWPMFPLMGRDYESAVMASGICGFMLGITANSMANMEALADRYGPAPRAFLVVPMVGAFFIDFTNAVMITVLLNLWR